MSPGFYMACVKQLYHCNYRKALAEAKLSGGGRSLCSFRSCILFIISAVLCGVILLMGWMLMNVQKDIQDLKERIGMGKSAAGFQA